MYAKMHRTVFLMVATWVQIFNEHDKKNAAKCEGISTYNVINLAQI